MKENFFVKLFFAEFIFILAKKVGGLKPLPLRGPCNLVFLTELAT